MQTQYHNQHLEQKTKSTIKTLGEMYCQKQQTKVTVVNINIMNTLVVLKRRYNPLMCSNNEQIEMYRFTEERSIWFISVIRIKHHSTFKSMFVYIFR